MHEILKTASFSEITEEAIELFYVQISNDYTEKKSSSTST